VNPYDNALAFIQMEAAYKTLLSRGINTPSTAPGNTKTTKIHPRIFSLGGDHSIALPALRALGDIYGSLSVVHFDSHLDTWSPGVMPSAWSSTQSELNHGTMFWMASKEGLIANGTSIHAGLRTRLAGKTFSDYEHDAKVGFVYIEADDIDTMGVQGIIDTIIETVGTTNPVYLSVDIDVIDPGLCPGTGTPESGGWTTRELRQIIRGLHPLRIVGGDLVEMSPPYDVGDVTALAASDLIFEVLSIMVKNPGFEGPNVDVAPRLPQKHNYKGGRCEL